MRTDRFIELAACRFVRKNMERRLLKLWRRYFGGLDAGWKFAAAGLSVVIGAVVAMFVGGAATLIPSLSFLASGWLFAVCPVLVFGLTMLFSPGRREIRDTVGRVTRELMDTQARSLATMAPVDPTPLVWHGLARVAPPLTVTDLDERLNARLADDPSDPRLIGLDTSVIDDVDRFAEAASLLFSSDELAGMVEDHRVVVSAALTLLADLVHHASTTAIESALWARNSEGAIGKFVEKHFWRLVGDDNAKVLALAAGYSFSPAQLRGMVVDCVVAVWGSNAYSAKESVAVRGASRLGLIGRDGGLMGLLRLPFEPLLFRTEARRRAARRRTEVSPQIVELAHRYEHGDPFQSAKAAEELRALLESGSLEDLSGEHRPARKLIGS